MWPFRLGVTEHPQLRGPGRGSRTTPSIQLVRRKYLGDKGSRTTFVCSPDNPWFIIIPDGQYRLSADKRAARCGFKFMDWGETYFNFFYSRMILEIKFLICQPFLQSYHENLKNKKREGQIKTNELTTIVKDSCILFW